MRRRYIANNGYVALLDEMEALQAKMKIIARTNGDRKEYDTAAKRYDELWKVCQEKYNFEY